MRFTGHERLVGRAFGVLVSAALMFGASAGAAGAATSGSDTIAGTKASERKLSANQLPDVALATGILVDGEGDVLWARKPTQKRAMASITKIMTALVALENSSPDEIVTVKSRAVPGESNVGLEPGDKIPMRQLLEGLLVKSGGDAARAIAVQVGGSEDKFVDMMNQKAKDLGLKNTHFANPHGLDSEGHYSSANDLQKLAREAMKSDEFRAIVKKTSTKVGGRTFQSTDRLLGSYPGAIGIKTGFTDNAGHSIVSAASRDGRTMYAVVLGAPSDSARFADARTLLDWGFQHVVDEQLASAGEYVGTVPVGDYIDTSVGALVGAETSATVFDLRGKVTSKVVLDESVKAPVAKGQKLGTVTFVQDGETVATAPLVASRDIPAPTVLDRVGIGLTRAWRSVFGPRQPAPEPVVVANP